MKRIINTGFAFLLMISILLTACSNQEVNTETKEKKEIEPIVTEAGTFPIVKEKVTLKVLVKGNSFVEDIKTNEFTKWMEEKTNVHVEWEVLPEQSAAEKLNLVLASGDYPDVIMDAPLSTAQLMIYGKQGVFLPLNDLIEKYGIETKKMFEELPIVKDTITTPDGNIYSLPQVNVCYHCSVPEKLWINKTWLDKLGLEMPTTTEEFYQVLKAFKEKDPNGNGKADEIPLAGSPKAWGAQVDFFLMNPFIFSGNANHLFVDNGKIDVAFNKPEWKKGLQYLRMLNKEGLLSSESFTLDGTQYKKIGSNPDAQLLGVGLGASTGGFTSSPELGKDFVALAPLEGPNGNRISQNYPNPVTRPAEFVITKNAKHPDVALRWADAMFNEEITMRSVLGIEGENWRKAEDGELGIDGKPGKYYRIPGKEEGNNKHWSQTGPSLRTAEFRLAEVVDETNQEKILYEATNKQYEPYKADEDMLIPPLFFSEEQAAELAELEKTVTDYVKEMTARFVTGDADIDKEWDSYIETLESMNLKRFIEINQTAYDAKYKK